MSTNLSRLQIEAFVGFKLGSLVCASCCLTAEMPSEFGILIYKLVTSNVQRIGVLGRFIFSNSQRKCPLSLTYDFCRGTRGWIKWSTNWDMCSVGQSFADTIGLPGGGILPLCILGSK